MNAPPIATASVAGGDRPGALASLVGRAASSGWLRGVETRVVVQVDPSVADRVPGSAVEDLAGALRAALPSASVEVTDGSAGRTVVVKGLGGSLVRIPREGFERRFLVTLTAPRPDRRWRLSGALVSQARPIVEANPSLPPARALAEAQRLIGADLAVACGVHPDSGEWWALGPSPVQVDASLARAAGIDPLDSPAIREVARHERFEPGEVAASLPDLSGAVAGPASVAWTKVLDSVGVAIGRVAEDLRRTGRNLPKIPKKVRGRLLRMAGKGGAA